MVEVVVKRKNLVCVEYPATVRNVGKMIQSLGGEERMSQVYSDPSRRMELRFRPNDILCKAVCGDRLNTTYLLMRVRRKRTKKRRTDSDKQAFKVDVEGIANVTYKFQGLADFQYLPMCRLPDGTYENVLHKLTPRGLPPSSWLEGDAPLFVVPPMFSRLDTPSNYHRDPTPRASTKEALALQKASNIMRSGRKRRIGHAIFVSFDDTEIPTDPVENALKNFNTYQIGDDLRLKARQLFQERPVWSKIALTHALGCDANIVKHILPALSFYFLMGPWRATWVRLGYDPRKDPSAKIYQVLDYRLHYSIAKYRETIKPKRSMHSYTFAPLKANPGVPRTSRIQMGDPSFGASEVTNTGNEHLLHQFIPGHLPPHHQMHYQLCDIHVDEIQELIHSNDGKEVECHERDGWLPLGTLEKCRQILFKHIKQTLAELSKGQEQSLEQDDTAGGDDDEMSYPSDPDYDPLEDDEVLMYMADS